MSEPIEELASEIQRLELRLAISRSEFAHIRERALKSPSVMPILVGLIVASTMLLRAAPPKTTTVVTAPFQVFDDYEKKILEVTDVPRGFALYDSAEDPLVWAIAAGSEAYLEAGSADGAVDARMGVLDRGTGAGEDGPIPVFTARYSGSDLLSLALPSGGASFDMTSDENTCGVEAGVNHNKGGYLALCSPAEGVRVRFSTMPNGAGTVVTYPNGNAGGAIVGLKGSMLCGMGGCGK